METIDSTTGSNSTAPKVWKLNGQDISEDQIPDFLESSTRGLIKVSPISDTVGEEMTFWAEDVIVTKELPLKTASTIDGGKESYSSENSDSGDTEQNTDPRLTIKFNIQITPNGMTRGDFKEKRAGYLYGFENTQVMLTSDMFKKALPMQFTTISYTIPQGSEHAQYEVELTQITESEQTTSDFNDTPTCDKGNGKDPNGMPCKMTTESYSEFYKRGVEQTNSSQSPVPTPTSQNITAIANNKTASSGNPLGAINPTLNNTQ